MPVSAEKRALYPANWKEIVARILARAGHRCECSGRCGRPHDGGRCGAPNGAFILRAVERLEAWILAPSPGEKAPAGFGAKQIKVVLTTAHLDDPNPANCADENLASMCQLCHLRLDAAMHGANARATRRAQKAHRELF